MGSIKSKATNISTERRINIPRMEAISSHELDAPMMHWLNRVARPLIHGVPRLFEL